ncbi:MAG: hypothetical protein AAGF53_18260 [Pseudomonadota bacterium]
MMPSVVDNMMTDQGEWQEREVERAARKGLFRQLSELEILIFPELI